MIACRNYCFFALECSCCVVPCLLAFLLAIGSCIFCCVDHFVFVLLHWTLVSFCLSITSVICCLASLLHSVVFVCCVTLVVSLEFFGCVALVMHCIDVVVTLCWSMLSLLHWSLHCVIVLHCCIMSHWLSCYIAAFIIVLVVALLHWSLHCNGAALHSLHLLHLLHYHVACIQSVLHACSMTPSWICQNLAQYKKFKYIWCYKPQKQINYI